MTMGAVCYLAYTGFGVAAGALGGTAITVFGGAFLLARHLVSRSEQEEKSKLKAPPAKKTGKPGKQPRR